MQQKETINPPPVTEELTLIAEGMDGLELTADEAERTRSRGSRWIKPSSSTETGTEPLLEYQEDLEPGEACPACHLPFDGMVCGVCGYREEDGPCPDCGTYLGFDGVVCDRCFYHVAPLIEERWIDRLGLMLRNVFPAIREILHRRAMRLTADDELPF